MNTIEQAFQFALSAHHGQSRKLFDFPYIYHPMEVAKTLAESGMRTEVVVAGFLHDTVEDTDVTLDDIHQAFGAEVVRLVSSNTEDKTKSWEERKRHTLDTLRVANVEERALVVADKLSNLYSLHRTLEAAQEPTEVTFGRFNRGKQQQAWYFRGVAEAMYENLTPTACPAFFREYQELVEKVFPETEGKESNL